MHTSLADQQENGACLFRPLGRECTANANLLLLSLGNMLALFVQMRFMLAHCAGIERKEPNVHPFLPEPARFEFSLNPFKVWHRPQM
jgi:hypothetical protein